MGGRNDSLESILLIRWHRGRDFLKQNKNKDQENNEEMILYYSPDGQILEYLHSISQAVNFVLCMWKSELQVENKNQESLSFIQTSPLFGLTKLFEVISF